MAAEREGVLDFGAAESFAGFAKDDLVSFAQFILIAGNETTRNAISRGMLALTLHPEQRALLRARPELLPRAVDEILRWSSPVRVLRRVLLRDTELRGKNRWSSEYSAVKSASAADGSPRSAESTSDAIVGCTGVERQRTAARPARASSVAR